MNINIFCLFANLQCRHTFLCFLLFAAPLSSWAQTKVFGYVLDAESREPLVGAIVWDSLSKQIATSNEYGYFVIHLEGNSRQLKISYVGYITQYQIVSQDKQDLTQYFLLTTQNTLSTITIRENTRLEHRRPNEITFLPEKLNSIPALGGEKDLLKALTILPGISNGAEGTSSLLVRGGGQDQNLFILDGATVYNSGHLFNLISVFNPEALKKLTFYKAGFPARFGGRLSSVADVTFKEGNKQQFKGGFEIGLINSKLLLEGPIGKKGKTSYLFAARSMYLGAIQWLLGNSPRMARLSSEGNYLNYTFYDINAKLTHEFNDVSKLSLSYYEGFDGLTLIQNAFTDRSNLSRVVNNRLISARYNYLVSNKLSLNFLASYVHNGGKNELNNANANDLYRAWDTSRSLNFIQDYAFKTYLEGNMWKQHFWRVGIEGILHQYKTYQGITNKRIDIAQNDTSFIRQFQLFSYETTILNRPTLHSQEYSIFLEDDYALNDRLTLYSGLRWSAFYYDKLYWAIEPRFSLKYNIPNIAVINATITKTTQYNHALINPSIGLDKITWLPATTFLPPQYSWQYSVGAERQYKNWETSLSFFYKKMSDLSQANFLFTDTEGNVLYNWEQNMLANGTGLAYGLEYFLNYNSNIINTSLSYTLSWSLRKYDGLNKGNWFYDKYDRRNVITLNNHIKLSSKWTMGFLWTYSTGIRMILPDGQTQGIPFFNQDILLYTQINNAKMRDYHRLDINLVYSQKTKRNRIKEFSFNIYNAYNQFNPVITYISQGQFNTFTQTQEPTQLKAISFLGIIPSINYGLKF